MELSAGKLWGLRRLADAGGRFTMLAVDQRPPIKNHVSERRGVDPAPYGDVSTVKRLLVEELGPLASAVLLDPHFAYPAAIDAVDPRQGLILTLEDSVFHDGPGGRRSSAIDSWSVAKIKRTGADAVKVLAWYRPDAAPEVRDHQQRFVASVGDDCRRHDIPFVFELLLYPFAGEDGHTDAYVESPSKRADHVIESVVTFAHPRFGVDLFKLESPVPASQVPEPDHPAARQTQDLFDRLGEAAGRPWVMLSAGADPASFRRVLTFAYRAGASGYLAGRAIWWEAFQAFPDLERMRVGLAGSAAAYMTEINSATARMATPWFGHLAFGSAGPRLQGAGPGFRHAYPEDGGAHT